MRPIFLCMLMVMPLLAQAQTQGASKAPTKVQTNAQTKAQTKVQIKAQTQAAVEPIEAHVEVKQMASDYLRTHASLMSPKVRVNAEQTFIGGFKQGYSDVGETDNLSADSADPFEAGYKAGAELWKKFPEKRDYILAGFGYTKLSTSGKWQLGFESSLLTMQNGMSCWLSPMNNAIEGIAANGGSVQFETILVDVEGYLSPEGKYGHLGMARCEIIASSVRPTKKAN